MRPAYFSDGFAETPLYDGPRLASGVEIRGPALIEEPFTVVVLSPGHVARLDGDGNYDVRFDRGGSAASQRRAQRKEDARA